MIRSLPGYLRRLRHGNPWSTFWVMAFFLFCAAWSGWFVHSQATRLPLMDEWDLLHTSLVFEETHDRVSWLFYHHNEHRYPLGKLLWRTILELGNYRFHLPAWFSWLLLCAASLLALDGLRLSRGCLRLQDAFIPALFLHFGHGFNLQMGFQLTFALVLYAGIGWWWSVIRFQQQHSPLWLVLSLAYSLSLIFAGGFGLLLTPSVVLWSAWLLGRARFHRWWFRGMLVLHLIITIAYSGWVFSTMPRLAIPTVSPVQQPGEFTTACIGFLQSSWGAGIWENDAFRALGGIITVGLYVYGFRYHFHRRQDPQNIVGLLLLLGTLLLACASAHSRGMGLVDRYTTISLLGLWAALQPLFQEKFATLFSSRFRRIVFGLLIALSCYTFWHSQRYPALLWSYRTRHATDQIMHDINQGITPRFLTGKHGGGVAVLVGDRWHEQLLRFQAHGIPPWQRLEPDQPLRFAPITKDQLALPVRWSCSESEMVQNQNVPQLVLPPPPREAVALAVQVRTVRSLGVSRLSLQGSRGAVDAFPCYLSQSMTLIFPLKNLGTNLLLRPLTALDELELQAAFWMMP